MTISVSAKVERWPVDGAFIISRGAKTYVDVVVCEVSDGVHKGIGEATPIYYEGETADSCKQVIEAYCNENAVSRQNLISQMPKGAARNALDCALWDLECQQSEKPLWELVGQPKPKDLTTAFTISLAGPAKMEADARAASKTYPLLKLKLSGENDRERVAAVHRGAPNARLIVDANESWNNLNIEAEAAHLSKLGVELIEQPVSAGQDHLLAGINSPIPLCADESCHTSTDVVKAAPYYGAVNIKLDKAGGLTEALAMADTAKRAGLDIMVGCMLSTSLAIRPAFILAQGARWVDLDGPLLLAKDHPDRFKYQDGRIFAG